MLASTLFYTSAVQLLAHLTLLVFLFDLILRLIELESSRFHLQLISKAFCVVFHNHRPFSSPVDNFDLFILHDFAYNMDTVLILALEKDSFSLSGFR